MAAALPAANEEPGETMATKDINRPRLVLADDSQVVLNSIQRLLDPHFEVVATVRDGCSLLEAADSHDPDVLVVDISMPCLNGIEATKALTERHCRGKIVVLTTHCSRTLLHKAMAAGATGYVLKTNAAENLSEAIHQAMDGQRYACPSLQA